ncbi:hypothetical protein ABEP17_19360 [Priestia flexa]|uniref:hypothetical protein n=1 Tax=Priestia flexa TaxID=86664 RepID=UPI003D28B55A
MLFVYQRFALVKWKIAGDYGKITNNALVAVDGIISIMEIQLKGIDSHEATEGYSTRLD